MKIRVLLSWISLLFFSIFTINAQETFPVNGSNDHKPQLYAFTHATIVTGNGKTISDGTLLIDHQKIVYVGNDKAIPKGYVVQNLKGKYIYPSFIDLFSTYGVEQPKSKGSASWGGPQIFTSQKEGAYNWNEAIHPESQAYKVFSIDNKNADKLQQYGFGAVQTLEQDGIARGSSALVSLAKSNDNEVVLIPEAAAQYAFDKGTSRNSYPGSIMGSVALLRQTYYDAEWYAKHGNDYNISLEEFGRLQNLPQIFEATNLTDLFRINRLKDEFGKNYIIKTDGEEYKRIDFLKEMGAPLIVPLDFPEPYDVENPLDAADISLSKLKHWELAPSNPARLAQAGIEFSLTAYGLKEPKEFWKNLRKSIAYGLSQDDALKALTLTPAKYLGIEDKLGSLEAGKIANFLITDAPIFEEQAKILENWTQGHQNILQSLDLDLRGTYTTSDKNALKIEGKLGKYEATLNGEKASFKQDGELFWVNSTGLSGSIEGYIAAKDPITLKGKRYHKDGSTSSWEASLNRPYSPSSKTKSSPAPTDLGEVLYPFVGYGHAKDLKTQTVLFKNVTAWTNEEEGILENTDLLIENGKIKAIGKNLKAPQGAITVDGTGKHLTPGIIDEHSHLALEAWNESAQEVSAEVRMLDAINTEDINIYRQLAGGVTTSQLLHGSANPIGGQSQLIKMRWGSTQDGYVYKGHKSIKFALGENVKQSNRSTGGNRFPQTRMGVEQVFTDAFTRAYEYKKAKAQNKPVRKDLELDALVEIIDGERDITSHSYVQSEINMLMEVAEKMNFKINTFTHGLETYKLADKIAERGITVGTFSDWWAYKYEVAEATPYNAHILDEQGVTVAINSDDEEMARRLNQEAGKIVKYGGTSPENAFKMVTLNPAKILGIDDKVGSLKVGKDADLVLWSDDPLSIYAIAEQTYVEGIKYWDVAENEEKQQEIAKERKRLIDKMIEAKSKKESH